MKATTMSKAKNLSRVEAIRIVERHIAGEDIDKIAHSLGLSTQKLLGKLSKFGTGDGAPRLNDPTKIPDKRKHVAVFLKGSWHIRPRHKKDNPGKKNLTTFRDDSGKITGYRWLTSEQRLTMSLQRTYGW